MTQEATYTLIQRDQHGDAVNAIPGLNEASANDLADVLRLGDAYQGDKPWTCEIVREQTPAEQAQEAAAKWRDASAERGGSLHKVSHIAQILRTLAEDLDHLGETDIPSTILAVKIQVCGLWGAPEGVKQIAAVDRIAHALGQQPHRYETNVDGSPSHYGTGHGDLIVVTTAQEPKPLVSDETIREAEQIAESSRLARIAEEAETLGHSHAAGSAGPAGCNSAVCLCGVEFNGFETYSGAMAALDRHLALAVLAVSS